MKHEIIGLKKTAVKYRESKWADERERIEEIELENGLTITVGADYGDHWIDVDNYG